MEIVIKRVYEPYSPDDGCRVLVDRVWPRGLTKEKVHYDEWERALAPSTAVRKAFGHKPENWPTFQQQYRAELDANPAAAAFAAKLAGSGFAHCPRVTLLYGARNETQNQAVVLAQWLKEKMAMQG